MRSIRLAATSMMLAATLAACSSTGHPTVSRSPLGGLPLPTDQTGSPSATPTPTPTVTPGPTGTPAATTVDPCRLVTRQEASALTGVSYGPGKLEIDSTASRRCIYGARTPHVFTVIIVRAATAGAAKAYATTLRAEAQQQLGAQVSLKKVTGIGDDAESLRASKSGIDLDALYVLNGVYGLGLVDLALGHAASITTLMSQARTSIGRLP